MRQYLIGSWNNADSYDYSGEQLMGNRLGTSREVRHTLPNGKANLDRYGDKAPKKISKPITKQSLVESIIPQEKRYANLEAKLTQLEKNKHLMTFEEYSELRLLLERKLSRQWQLIEKARGWEEERPKQNKALSRQILSENKRSALKAKEPKAKTENVKHDRKSLSKVAEFLAKNDWATFTLASIIVFIGTQIIF